MRDCWLEPYSLRPSFTDIVLMLENIIENDAVRTDWLLWLRYKLLLKINCELTVQLLIFHKRRETNINVLLSLIYLTNSLKVTV